MTKNSVTNSIGDSTYRPESGLPFAWAEVAAEIVEALEAPVLPELLVRLLGTLIDFDDCEQFVYRRDNDPVHIYDSSLSTTAKSGLTNYLASTYVLSPFYKGYCSGLSTGAYRLRDLARKFSAARAYLNDFSVSLAPAEEIGYLTEGLPAGRKELCIALEMPTGECAEITLARGPGGQEFTLADVERLSPVTQFLAAAFHRYWCSIAHARMVDCQNLKRSQTVLEGPSNALLSPREREVANLLLAGHSNLSIGLQLGISTTTVKSHRKNLYAKLGIATQYEFFRMFADSLTSRSPRSSQTAKM